MKRSSRNSCRAGAVLGWLAVFAAPSPAAAQTTIDGTYCVVFVEGTFHGELARCVRSLGKDHPLKAATLTLALIGDAPNSIHHVALSLDGAAAFQELPVSAAPPITNSDVGVIFTDINYDGFIDFGVMTTAAAGPAGTYRWFLFRPDKGQFAASIELSALLDPHADAVSQRITSQRRGLPAGSDLYRWQGDMLLLDERIERKCTGGRCSCRYLVPERHGYALKRSGACD